MGRIEESLGGIIPPLVTPFDDGQIDWDSYGSLLDHVIAGGVNGVFPCGTTGEAASLTLAEREALVEETVAHTPESIPVFAGGTSSSLPETIEWAETVAALGGDALVVTAPYFHEANDPTGYRTFFEAVADASPVPIVLYNIPAYVGVQIPQAVVQELANHSSIIGLKDSSGDFGYGSVLLDRTPDDFLIVQGFDNFLLPGTRVGFHGGINAGANLVPEAYRSILDDTANAEEVHRTKVLPVFEACTEHGFATAVKAALAADGIIESAAVRPPLVAIKPDILPTTMQNFSGQ